MIYKAIEIEQKLDNMFFNFIFDSPFFIGRIRLMYEPINVNKHIYYEI